MLVSHGEASLVLWDVDQTLVSVGGVSRSIYERAFRSVTGAPLRELAPMTGRTERAIVIDTLKMNGVEDPDSLVSAFYSALDVAAQELEGEIRRSGILLPGAHEAITTLAGRRTVQSVVTGNIRPIARIKLEAFGLAGPLDLNVGGYGDDGSDRTDLVRLACERASVKYGVPFAGKRVFVVGDTPHDIKGAHGAGVYAVGVATGSSSPGELDEAGADLVIANLTEIEKLHAAVFNVG